MLQDCYMARKTTKLCPVCGKEFKGTDGKITCSNACRTAASRMLAKGKKPEFWLIAKSKGQKLPIVFNGPIPSVVKPKKEDFNGSVNLTAKIDYTTTIPESYDSPLKSAYLLEEVESTEPPKELKWEQKMAFNAEIDRKISEERNKKHQTGMHPRQFRLQQEDKIAELEKQKIKS